MRTVVMNKNKLKIHYGLFMKINLIVTILIGTSLHETIYVVK